MRTIERAVDLLEPLERPTSSPQERSRHQLDERQIEELAEAGRPEPVFSGPGTGLTAKDSGVPDSRSEAVKATPQFFRIDRAHLRRQGVIAPDGSRSVNGETFRRIKRQILAAAADKVRSAPSNLVLVTSALPGEGKTYCAVSLAISMALEMDRTVLLVDADVAKPSIPGTLGVRAGRGLLDVLVDRNIGLPDVLCKTDIGKLTFLPAGSPHPQATELLASESMHKLLQEVSRRYRDRIVIFDSPPLLAASEAVALAGQVGQIVMVVEAGKTSEEALTTALSRVETNNVTGLILNKGEAAGLRYHYGEYGPAGT